MPDVEKIRGLVLRMWAEAIEDSVRPGTVIVSRDALEKLKAEIEKEDGER